jgi:hypothetical protein
MVVATFGIALAHVHGGTEKNYESLSENRRCPCRNSNRAFTKVSSANIGNKTGLRFADVFEISTDIQQ